MLENLLGVKIELKPKQPNENEKLCETCGGTGWLYEKEKGYIEHCPVCYGGIIKLCPICKQPKRGICTNTECRNKYEFEEEQKRYEKAIKLSYEETPEEYKEMMFSESYGYNEGYFSDFGELEDYCEDEEIPMPDYVWSTSETKISIDASSIIDSACCDLHEDAYDNITGENELQAFLDEWCSKQTGTDTYYVNYKYAILVPKE